MSAAKHTPGVWQAQYDATWPHRQTVSIRVQGWGAVAFVNIDPSLPHIVEQQLANMRLIEAAPMVLDAVERAYTMFGDIRNSWPGRHTLEGQHLLSAMRDAISAATRRAPMDVQDDYCTRAAKALGEAAHG